VFSDDFDSASVAPAAEACGGYGLEEAETAALALGDQGSLQLHTGPGWAKDPPLDWHVASAATIASSRRMDRAQVVNGFFAGPIRGDTPRYRAPG
jgi:hypothetical protein